MKMVLIINAKNQILGRMCSEIAHKLLTDSEKIIVVNCRDTVISGREKNILSRFDERTERKGKSNPRNNPKYPKYPDKIVKYSVRGMLPRNARGLSALRRLKAYIDVPEEHKKDLTKEVSVPKISYMTLEQISNHFGIFLKK